MDFDTIFIAGPQGSGKGTQGKRLAQKLGFVYWGMGSMLRKISEEHTPLAEKMAGVRGGELLPDDLIIEILKMKLPTIPRDVGIIFDGVPRTIGQAEFMIPFLHQEQREKMATIFLTLPREESIKRLQLRSQNETRLDDTPEGIEMRFKFYDETIGRTMEYMKSETKYFEIDGRPSIDEIAAEIDRALGI